MWLKIDMAVTTVLWLVLLAGVTDCQILSNIIAKIPGNHSVGSSIVLMADFTPPAPANPGDELSVTWQIDNAKLTSWFMEDPSNTSMDSEGVYEEFIVTFYLNVSYENLTRKMMLTIENLVLDHDNSVVQAIPDSFTDVWELPTENYTLKISECVELRVPPKTEVQYSNGRNYGSTTTYTCLRGNLYVDNAYDEAYTQTCNVSAKWDSPAVGECWFTSSSINVTQNTFIENENLHLSCNASNDSFPDFTGFEYFINKSLLPVSYKLTSDDYNSTYACRVVSEYTSINKSDGFSDDGKLIVFFGPKAIDHTPPKYIPVNQSEEVFVYIKANDKDNNLTVHMSKNGRNVSLELDQTLTLHYDIFYNYSYFFKIESEEDYGVYVFNAYTSLPADSLAVNIYISNSEITTPHINTGGQTNNLGTGVIIGICAAGIAIVFLVIFLIVCRRRRQKKSADKEQRMNPIYDVSNSGAVPEKEDRVNPLYGGYNELTGDETNVKEERVNPLYGSTNDGSSANKKTTTLSNPKIEEAYSTVEKGGKNNPVFSVGCNNDTYAEVKKVNPKKDKNATPSAECMYAEVKKDKPETKDTGTGLHGSTDSTSTK